MTAYASKAQKNALSGQIDIFGSLGVEENLPGLRLDPPPKPVTVREQLVWEKELLGMYLSHHPLDDYGAFLADSCQPIARITPESDGKLVRIGGLITSVRRILTKKGANMAFVAIEDKTGVTELIVFPKAYEKDPEVYEVDNVIMATGKISAKDKEGRLTSEPKVMVDGAKIVDYDTAKAHKPRKDPAPVASPRPAAPPRQPATASSPAPAASTPGGVGILVIRLQDLSNPQLLHDIRAILDAHNGQSETFIVVGDETPKKIRLPFKVEVNDSIMTKLGNLVGPDRVMLARGPA